MGHRPVPATGHSYELTDGVMKCSVCGELLTGQLDGKRYADGILLQGWDGESYYVDGVALTGLQKIDGYYYDFGENGVCPGRAKLNGFYYDSSVQAYRYFTAGVMAIGEVDIYPNVYFYDENGCAISGQVNLLGYVCHFDEKGAFVSSDDKNVVDAGFSGTNIQYVLLSDGTLKVDGTGAIKDYTANGIYPAWIIKNDMNQITALEIGSGITKIGRFCLLPQRLSEEHPVCGKFLPGDHRLGRFRPLLAPDGRYHSRPASERWIPTHSMSAVP